MLRTGDVLAGFLDVTAKSCAKIELCAWLCNSHTFLSTNPQPRTRSIRFMPHSHPQSRELATLVFDGDCGFCTSSVDWLARTLPAMPKSIPFQWAPLEDLGLTLDETKDRVWLVTTDRTGRLHQYGGYLAVSTLLRHQPHRGWRFLGILLDTPPFSLAAGAGYALVARFRYLLPGGTPACKMRPTE